MECDFKSLRFYRYFFYNATSLKSIRPSYRVKNCLNDTKVLLNGWTERYIFKSRFGNGPRKILGYKTGGCKNTLPNREKVYLL